MTPASSPETVLKSYVVFGGVVGTAMAILELDAAGLQLATGAHTGANVLLFASTPLQVQVGEIHGCVSSIVWLGWSGCAGNQY